jgi:GT2 family glycosyltransferase
MDPQAPPVVAVVVTADAGDWLEEALSALGAQDYQNLSVLIVDAGSAVDPTPRIAEVLPGAFVRRLDRPVGFAAAANEAMATVEGAAFFLLCHDDVAPDPPAVRLLVEEAFRSNAGIVAPKLVSWEDSEILLQVGMSADKSGTPVPLAQPGEMDQEQHDAVRDVFVAPGGAVLVRADLFCALSGFDPQMVLYGEDLDFCWRAQVAGARVVVAPAARVRHLAAASSGRRVLQGLPGLPGTAPALFLHRRHELRAALKTYSAWHLIRVLPQLLGHTLTEAVVASLSGRRSVARAAASAWIWNLRRVGELRIARRAVRAQRTLPDSEVRRLQSSGSARLSHLAESVVLRASARVPHLEEPDHQPDRGQLGFGWPIAVAVAVIAFWLVGSRSLFGAGPAEVGQLLDFGSAGHLLGAYASSRRSSGLGQVSPAPVVLAFTGVLSFVLGGSGALARTVLVLGMLPLGALGAYRLSRPLASSRARLLAPVVYLALPLPYDAMVWGRLGDLVVYGLAPWILLQLARASGLAPFPDAGVLRSGIRLGLLLALGAAFVPGLPLAAVLLGLALLGGAALAGGGSGGLRALVTSVGGAVLAYLLCLPWTTAVLSPAGFETLVLGPGRPGIRAVGLGSLLGFHAENGGSNWVGWSLLLAMAVPLAFGRDWRLGWGIRLWSVGLWCWLVAWALARGLVGPGGVDVGALVALGGAALTLSALMGVVAFETDLVGFGLGWRQAVSVLGLVGAVVGVLGALGHVTDGRWDMPAQDLRTELAALPSAGRAAAVLWVGDPAALPGSGWQLEPGVAYQVWPSLALPDLAADAPPPRPGPAQAVARDLRQAETGATGRLGHYLAAAGIRYVLVPTQLGPDGPSAPPPPRLVQALARQSDMEPVSVDPTLLVFQNDVASRVVTPPPQGGHRAAWLILEGLVWLLVLGGVRWRPGS